MSASPDRSAPRTPYVEDCDDSQDEKPAAPARANTAKKVTRRDEASDSGYSSHTVTTGSSSRSSRGKKPPPSDKGGFFSKMGKKPSAAPKKDATKKPATVSPVSPAPPVSPKATRLGRATKTEDLRSAAGKDAKKASSTQKRSDASPVEKRNDRRNSSSRPPLASQPRPVSVIYDTKPPPPVISPPQPDPRARTYYVPRTRPFTFHEGMPVHGPPPTLVYPERQPMYSNVMHMPVYANVPPFQYATVQPASPTHRLVNYGVPHTEPQYVNGPWTGPIQPAAPPPPPPPPPRRFSVTSPPGHNNALISYPTVPQGHGWTDGYEPDYPTHLESPAAAVYDPPLEFHDEESFYRQQQRDLDRRELERRELERRREKEWQREEWQRKMERQRELDAASMPPPQKPARPGLPFRAATVTASGRSNRAYKTYPSQSPRESSFDAYSRPPSRPGPPHRSSQSSSEQAPPTAPSPTARRRPSTHQRPVSHHEAHDKYQAAEDYQKSTGTASNSMTAAEVKSVVRQKSSIAPAKSKQTKSTRSHSSRTSSKSSDPKKKLSTAEKPRERESVTVRFGKKMGFTFQGGQSFSVHQNKDNTQIHVDSKPSRSRDGRGKERARSTKYQATGSSNGRSERGDVEVNRSSRPRSRSHSRRRQAANEEAIISPTAGDGEVVERTRTQSRSRRSSSRSGRRPVLE